jgi:hypothetical protein
MLNKQERMEKLNAMGVNTQKYFSVDLDNGTKIHLIIDENGDCKQVKGNDPILDSIIEDGYVRNTKLHRRFVMAQMFQMLNYVSYDGRSRGYNDYLKTRYAYDYTFKMMLEEVRVLSKLEERDKETFLEREHFFNRQTVAKVLEDYLDEFKKYVDTLPVKKCKGVPYKRVKGINIFVADFDKKLYFPVKSYASQIRCAKDYNKVYNVLKEFMKNMVKLPYNTRKSKTWIDAYKGAGAYYTLKNLIMFHDCYIEVIENSGSSYNVSGQYAMKVLHEKLDEYKGEYYRMFALMKKVIVDNEFDFKKRMTEIYNK